MKYLYLIIAVINAVYGILLLTMLTTGTPGYMIVLTIGLILTILGLSGFFLWIRNVSNILKNNPFDDEILKSWWGLTKSFDLVLIIGLICRTLILQPFVVEGNSMEPDFHNNQALIVDKISYRFRAPTREEVIIFKAPPKPSDNYIKRVIGIPGDTVEIKNGHVYVNDNVLNENYVTSNNQTFVNRNLMTSLKKTLQKDEYFVLGDNRTNSSDSREWGVVPKNNLIGRPVLSVYPVEDFGIISTPKTN